MGGVGISLKLAPRDSKRRRSPKDLYRRARQFICQGIVSVAPAAAYKNAIAEHFVEYGEEENSETELSFSFYDGGGGCSVSHGAVCHWFQLVIAALRDKAGAQTAPFDALVNAAGYDILDPPEDLAALLEPSPRRSIYMVVRGRLLHVYRDKSGLDFEANEGQALVDVTASERVAMQAALDARACACGLCIAMRKGKRPARPKPPKEKPNPLAGEMAKKKRLDFSKLRLKELPPEIVLAKNLASLSVVHTPITRLPDQLGSLPKLADLTLVCTKVAAIPASFANHAVLRSVYVQQKDGERHLKDFAVVESLAALHRLSLIAIGPSVASLDVSLLKALECLELDRNELVKLPHGVEQAHGLDTLSLKENALTALPAALQTLTALTSLHLAQNQLRSVPDVVAELPALEYLDLGHNPLSALSTRLCSSRSLRHLVLTRTKELKSLPKEIGNLTSLEQLDLRYSGITSLPDELGALTSLEFLSLEDLPLKELPAPVRELRKLRALNLEDTQIATLPEWLGELPLEKLWVTKKTLAQGEVARIGSISRAKVEVR